MASSNASTKYNPLSFMFAFEHMIKQMVVGPIIIYKQSLIMFVQNQNRTLENTVLINYEFQDLVYQVFVIL